MFVISDHQDIKANSQVKLQTNTSWPVSLPYPSQQADSNPMALKSNMCLAQFRDALVRPSFLAFSKHTMFSCHGAFAPAVPTEQNEVPLTCPHGRQHSPGTKDAALESDCLGSSPVSATY